jgi:uncharacterized membrane protein YadS
MPNSRQYGTFLAGLALCLSAALLAWMAAARPWNHKLQLSPLTLAIVAGIVLGNTVPRRALERLHPGLRFCQQKLLRLGIVLYGIRLTVGDLAQLGPRALVLDLTVIGTARQESARAVQFSIRPLSGRCGNKLEPVQMAVVLGVVRHQRY